jgi:hypothetical protein
VSEASESSPPVLARALEVRSEASVGSPPVLARALEERSEALALASELASERAWEASALE